MKAVYYIVNKNDPSRSALRRSAEAVVLFMWGKDMDKWIVLKVDERGVHVYIHDGPADTRKIEEGLELL